MKFHSTSSYFIVINGRHLHLLFFQVQMPFIEAKYNPISLYLCCFLEKKKYNILLFLLS